MACLFCKSKDHNYRRCPLINKFLNIKKNFKENYQGVSNDIFVGSYNYPRISLGILNIEKELSQKEKDFFNKKESDYNTIKEFILKQSMIINSRKQRIDKNLPSLESKNLLSNNKSNKEVLLAQEIAISKKETLIDFYTNKKPSFRMKYSYFTKPLGPIIDLKKAEAAENIKANSLLEKAYYDYDWKAKDAINSLYEKKISINKLQKAFSVGIFGLKKERKLVPTRWSITAIDDTISKGLITKIKNYNDYYSGIFYDSFFGNHFFILFLPQKWSYELIEIFDNGFDHDYELYQGRKDYAKNTIGGYYAARISILEKLNQIKKSSGVIIFRIITKEYYAPLGVWVVREGVKKALDNKKDWSLRELKKNIKSLIINKKIKGFNNERIDYLFKKSVILNNYNNNLLKYF